MASPRPWRVDDLGYIRDADDTIIACTFGAMKVEEIHAGFIIRAVNAYDRMREALEWIAQVQIPDRGERPLDKNDAEGFIRCARAALEE